MRRNNDFILREIGGDHIIIPTGMGAAQFSGMIELSETSAFVWKCLEQDCTREELLKKLTDEYEVSEETAAAELDSLLEKLKQRKMLL